jgi:hypothetical protein
MSVPDQQGSASVVAGDGRQVKLRQLEASCREGSQSSAPDAVGYTLYVGTPA